MTGTDGQMIRAPDTSLYVLSYKQLPVYILRPSKKSAKTITQNSLLWSIFERRKIFPVKKKKANHSGKRAEAMDIA